MKSNAKVYNRIKSVLAEKQTTNLELANKLGVTPLTVSRWATNAQQPSIEKLFEIAAALNVKVAVLLVESLP